MVAVLAFTSLLGACGSDTKKATVQTTEVQTTGVQTTGVQTTETGTVETKPSEPIETKPGAPAQPTGTTAGGQTFHLLTDGGKTGAWYIKERVTNGGAPELPDCAKDDELVFDSRGVFISVIGATKCNPNEVEVPNGQFAVSADDKVVTFTTPSFTYNGTILSLTPTALTIEFDLGPGQLIRDTLAKR
jgi:hypothetical protein